MTGWLTDAADLLAEPDPGPLPWLVEDLIVDKALIACVGRWKTTKSYGMLDICISIATGEPAFGKLGIPNPGQVVLISEESGRAALWRRLDALCRGRAIDPERLRDNLMLTANARVKLDDADWQERLLEHVCCYRTRLIAFDPLVRMKAATRDENAQKEMAGVIEFMRELRDTADAAVAFVHHKGHQGDSMRGTSDLESVWETKLEWNRDGTSPLITVKSEHREAEAGPPIKYRLNWDGDTRTMRLDLEGTEKADDLEQRVRAYLAEHPDATANEVDENVEGGRKKVLALVRSIKEQGGSGATGTTWNHPPAADPAGGSQVGLLEAPGTTGTGAGSNGSEPASDDPGHEDGYIERDYDDNTYFVEEHVA